MTKKSPDWATPRAAGPGDVRNARHNPIYSVIPSNNHGLRKMDSPSVREWRDKMQIRFKNYAIKKAAAWLPFFRCRDGEENYSSRI